MEEPTLHGLQAAIGFLGIAIIFVLAILSLSVEILYNRIKELEREVKKKK